MNKAIFTSVVVSKGFDGAPALSFTENDESVRFKVGEKVYDKRAENNSRWNNWNVKAFGTLAARIRKMNLKEGSYITVSGRFDTDHWEDKETGAKKSQTVLILDDIEYCYSGGDGSKKANSDAQGAPAGTPAEPAAPQAETGGFTGFEGFGDGNPIY